MKTTTVNALLKEVDRPGIDKHLVPLLYYRGQQSLGNIHRYWNFLLAMREQEALTMSDGTRMSRNGDYAHLCGPHTVLQMTSLRGFLSRLIDNKPVADNVPGLHDYARLLLPSPFSLTRVSPEASYKTAAPWRTYTPKRIIIRDREGDWCPIPGLRGPYTKNNLVSRILDKEKAEKNSAPLTLFYPFAVHDPGRPDEGFELTKLVNSVVPKHLPADRRADICQDLIVAILTGEISRESVKDSVRSFTSKIMKLHPTKYGDVSMDALIGDDDDFSRHGFDHTPEAIKSRLEW